MKRQIPKTQSLLQLVWAMPELHLDQAQIMWKYVRACHGLSACNRLPPGKTKQRHNNRLMRHLALLGPQVDKILARQQEAA